MGSLETIIYYIPNLSNKFTIKRRDTNKDTILGNTYLENT